eukprot:jgi/Chlat1/1220/Chrsp115S01681
MSFASNPLSLCVPDDELHAWIYDAGPADEHDGHKRRRRRQQQQQHQPDVSTPEAQAAVQAFCCIQVALSKNRTTGGVDGLGLRRVGLAAISIKPGKAGWANVQVSTHCRHFM